MTSEEHLADVLLGVSPALRKVAWHDEAAKLEALHGPLDVEDLFDLLNQLGPELVRAYVRANDFYRKAPEAIRQDALVFTRNLFDAKCRVAVARDAAKRVMRGEALVSN